MIYNVGLTPSTCSQSLTRTFVSGNILRQGSVSLNRAQGNHIILSIDYLVMCPSFSRRTPSKALRLQNRPSTSALRPPSPKTCFKLRSVPMLCAPANSMVATAAKIPRKSQEIPSSSHYRRKCLILEQTRLLQRSLGFYRVSPLRYSYISHHHNISVILSSCQAFRVFLAGNWGLLDCPRRVVDTDYCYISVDYEQEAQNKLPTAFSAVSTRIQRKVTDGVEGMLDTRTLHRGPLNLSNLG
jgi:hypothetical protein